MPNHPAMRAINTGQAELVSAVTDEVLQERTVDEGHRQIIRELGVKSYMIIPLITRDTTLGAILFASITRSYDAKDLVLAKDIASRAAVAIDNARMHERVHAASKAKSSFLALMSHELRTPLSAITGYTDLLDAGIPDPLTVNQKKQVGRIKLRAYDLLRIVEEILAFSRLQTGDEQFHREDVDVGEIVREVGAVGQTMAREHGLSMELRAPEQAAAVRTDPTKLRQILLDLISNAVKFTGKGTIALEGSVSNGTTNFRVKDTGIGIAPEYHEKIFEPFFQLEELNTREKGGTGIGLAVARGLARLLGGDITVESEPGRGSTFTVALPSHPNGTQSMT
jgi:signal transduction histidine kinase